ncbi:MAG TPA: hypothetical protein VHL58_01055 [Thermoanaerobaculia bacterium]|nr:hypothetical protein [Thermoanaerobaculia bacterium]
MRLVRILISLFLVTTPLLAWTPAADQRIARKSAQLAPPDLKLLLDRYRADYARGLQRAEADEGSEQHQYFVLSRKGQLKTAILSSVDRSITIVQKQEPMASFAEELGVLSHLVADANTPFHTADDDPRLAGLHDDYEGYFESRMLKFPTVFYGLEQNVLPSSLIERTMARSARFYPLLSEEYFRSGESHTSSEFDDRSTAFGIAAVSYSHSVTDLVNLYYYIWKQVGGDVRTASLLEKGNLLLNEDSH